MNGINRVILMGNIGGDPEVRVLESGIKLTRFSLATSESYLDKRGTQCVHTEWHNIVCWRGVATYAEQHFEKGSPVRIEGKLRSRQVIDPDTHHTTTIYEIIADSAQLMVNDLDQQRNIEAKHRQPSEVQKISPAPQDPDNLPF